MTSAQKEAQKEAISKLMSLGVVPGATIYTDVAHTSKSWTSRSIRCFVVHEGRIQHISYLVGRAVGRPIDPESIGVNCFGTGMDMSFELVYTLGRVMFPKGGALSEGSRRPLNRSGVSEENGGYLLHKLALV